MSILMELAEKIELLTERQMKFLTAKNKKQFPKLRATEN